MSSSHSKDGTAADRTAGQHEAEADHYDRDDVDEEDEALQQHTNKRRRIDDDEAEEQQHDDTEAKQPPPASESSAAARSSKPTAASRQTAERDGSKRKIQADDAKNTPSIASFFGGGKQHDAKKDAAKPASKADIASFFAPRTAKANTKPTDKAEHKEAEDDRKEQTGQKSAEAHEEAQSDDTVMRVNADEERAANGLSAKHDSPTKQAATSPAKQQHGDRADKQPATPASVKQTATVAASKKRSAPSAHSAAGRAAGKGKRGGPMSSMERKKRAAGKMEDDDEEEAEEAGKEDIDMSDVIDKEEAAIEEEDAAESSDEEADEDLAKELVRTDSNPHSSTPSTSSGTPLGTPSFHPIKNASWTAGQPVPYSALSAMFTCVEAESSRLKIISIVSDFFRSVLALTPADILPTAYLCINSIAPAYEGKETGVGDHILKKVIAQTTGLSLARLRELSKDVTDLGVLALSCRKKQVTLFSAPPLTVRGVFAVMREMAGMSGKNVATKKEGMITKLMVACKGEEAKFLIRSLQGSLRIGLQTKSVIASLARALVITPPAQATAAESDGGSGSTGSGKQVVDTRQQWSEKKFAATLEEGLSILKQAYIEVPNLDLLVHNILEYGLQQLPQHCTLTPGVPVEVMLGKPASSIVSILDKFSSVLFTLEYKYDGERAQIHRLKDGTVRVYSRNSENNTSKYPDIVRSIKQYEVDGKCSEWIVDCECVAWDNKERRLLPFQTLTTRKRKDVKEEDITVHVALFAFDLLYLNGQSYLGHTLRERREVLHSHFVEKEGEFAFAVHKDTDDLEEIQAFLTQAVASSCEGLMVKALEGEESRYTPGKRSWLKCKKDYLDGVGDTLDLVPIAAFYGKGKRTGAYGAYVLACYDDESEEYQSITKIGTGFSEDDITRHAAFYNRPAGAPDQPPPHQLPACPRYYKLGDTLKPDVWLAPVQVWEVKCADLSISPVHQAAVGRVDEGKGIALRFPRFVRVREDKKADEATTAEQVVDMFNNQSNRAGKKKGGDDDD